MPVDVREKLREQGDIVEGYRIENPEERVVSNRAEDLPPLPILRPANRIACPAIPDWGRCSFGSRVKIGIDTIGVVFGSGTRKKKNLDPTQQQRLSALTLYDQIYTLSSCLQVYSIKVCFIIYYWEFIKLCTYCGSRQDLRTRVPLSNTKSIVKLPSLHIVATEGVSLTVQPPYWYSQVFSNSNYGTSRTSRLRILPKILRDH